MRRNFAGGSNRCLLRLLALVINLPVVVRSDDNVMPHIVGCVIPSAVKESLIFCRRTARDVSVRAGLTYSLEMTKKADRARKSSHGRLFAAISRAIGSSTRQRLP